MPCHTGTTKYTTQFYKSYIPNNQTNNHNPNNQNKEINVGFITNTKFLLLQLRHRNFRIIHIEISQCIDQFRAFQFHPSPICTLHRFQKPCTWLDEPFRTFLPSLNESVAWRMSLAQAIQKEECGKNRAE